MDYEIACEVIRAARGAGYRTDELDRIALAVGLDRSPTAVAHVAKCVRRLLNDGSLMTIRSSEEGTQPGCYIVPSGFNEPHLPGYLATPWERCEPFGLPAVEGLDGGRTAS